MSLPDNLPHLCDITKSIPVRDEYNADIDEPEDFLLNEPCWVQPASDREINIFQRRDQVVTHTVYFRGNPGIRPGYIITPKDGAYLACPFAGATLEVKSANETTAGLGLLWKAMCEEIQPR
jgi:hypothetical protein